MNSSFLQFLEHEINKLKESGLYKSERILISPQDSSIQMQVGKSLINLCSNNYLGLADNTLVIDTAKSALAEYGYGLSSVRFICGTQIVHKELEKKLSQLLKTEDTILYSSCFDANTGLFETILNEEDAVISDELNHASIIDGIRLCKAKRFRYANNNMLELERHLQATQDHRFRLIATDGVFSMEGSFANLPKIVELANQYHALVMVDDSHATGFIGEEGGGTPDYFGLAGKIPILTGTLGKALGGASGGYVSGSKSMIAWLRQRSRPYLFSNTLAPMIAATSIFILDLIKSTPSLKETLMSNTSYFREKLTALGFSISSLEHPIIPIMINDAKLAHDMAESLLAEGIYVIAFSYPVVPMGKARIRTQISAAHSKEQLDFAVAAFEKVGRKLKVIA